MSADKPVFSPEHKKRIFQGIAAWLLISAALGFWVWTKAPQVEKSSEAHEVSVNVTPIYAETGDASLKQDPVIINDGNPYVSIIVTGMGLSEETTSKSIRELPKTVALAFSPYAELEKWLNTAKKNGHDALVLLPMEPKDYPNNDPGPLALLTSASDEKNVENTETILKHSADALGAMNEMGDLFIASKSKMSPVLETLGKQDKFFIARGVSEKNIYRQNGALYIPTDIEIDSTPSEDQIQLKLLSLENAAREKGWAVGIAQPYPVSINTISQWAKTLDRRGIRLVPVSTLAEFSEKRKPD